MRNIFSTADGSGQSDSRSAADTDHHISVVNARHSVIHDMCWYVDHSRVKNPRVEVWDNGLNTASERYS